MDHAGHTLNIEVTLRYSSRTSSALTHNTLPLHTPAFSFEPKDARNGLHFGECFEC